MAQGAEPGASALQAISNAMVRLHKDQFGRGPTNARAYFAGPDAVMCVLEDALLPAERKMVELGNAGRVRDSRVAFQAATEDEFVSAVEEILGRKVRRPYHAPVLEPGPFIQTLSGRRVNPLDAAVEDIDPADIARALSNLCRFGGHSKAFYSVAQHSAIVCDLLDERGATPDELMAALLHDAAEAYLGDLPHPLKHRSELGAAFRVAEKRLEAVIGERFALPDAAARIKPLDKALLATERRTFSEVTWHWPELEGAEELELEIEPWDSGRALREFTERYERIDALRRVPS